MPTLILGDPDENMAATSRAEIARQPIRRFVARQVELRDIDRMVRRHGDIGEPAGP